jgi:hypothetical protein
MTKYSNYSRRQFIPKTRQIHPIWRGIGFMLIILTPILAYAATLVLLDANRKQGWVALPSDIIIKGFSDPLILVKIILTIVLIILIGAVFSFITFLLYSIFAPPRYGPYDAPPVQYKGKPYKR